MKKQFLFIAVAVVASVLMTGCSTRNTSQGAFEPDVRMKTVEFTPVIEKQNKQVSGEASINCLFGIITWGTSKFADNAFITKTSSGFPLTLSISPSSVVKQGATYKACEAAKADMLLGAKYVIDVNDYIVFKTIKCKATGFPAVVKSVK